MCHTFGFCYGLTHYINLFGQLIYRWLTCKIVKPRKSEYLNCSGNGGKVLKSNPHTSEKVTFETS